MLEILRTTTICPESSLLFFWQKLVLIIAVILAIVYPYMACFHGYNEVTGIVALLLPNCISVAGSITIVLE